MKKIAISRKYARELAESSTNEEIIQMLKSAQKNVLEWRERSRVNKAMSRGFSFNLYSHGLNDDSDIHVLAKCNMCRDFGEYHLRFNPPQQKKNPPLPKLHHKDPFEFWN